MKLQSGRTLCGLSARLSLLIEAFKKAENTRGQTADVFVTAAACSIRLVHVDSFSRV